jgi:hypothetical protein
LGFIFYDEKQSILAKANPNSSIASRFSDVSINNGLLGFSKIKDN